MPLDNIAKRAEAYKPKERVTYKMIKEYIEAKYGFKVHTAYIAEVKRDLGLPMYDAPNAVEELKQPRKHPTPEKVEAIKDALKHFEVTTDKNGEIKVEGLRIGEYTVSEVNDKASAGYILPADQKVTVKTGETVTVTMHNELRDTPKTGDNFNPALWGGLAAACVLGAGVLGVIAFKGRKKKED